MKVLRACEFSSVVRDHFAARGHFAVSCDLLPCARKGKHYEGSVFDLLKKPKEWDMMIAFPPCTFLAVSGARWWSSRKPEQEAAEQFFKALADADIDKIAIENPIGKMSGWRKPDQIIQPWMFGHGETKATCLWLKNLPKLIPTDIVHGRIPRVHHESPGIKNGLSRQQRRSITYEGVALAMAQQWG